MTYKEKPLKLGFATFEAKPAKLKLLIYSGFCRFKNWETSVFSSNQGKTKTGHISRETPGAILRRLGYTGKHTTHGFRTTASTIFHEQGFNSDMIERQLAHAERNAVKAAYCHAEYLPERKQMMQVWANYLQNLKTNNNVVFGNFNKVG